MQGAPTALAGSAQPSWAALSNTSKESMMSSTLDFILAHRNSLEPVVSAYSWPAHRLHAQGQRSREAPLPEVRQTADGQGTQAGRGQV